MHHLFAGVSNLIVLTTLALGLSAAHAQEAPSIELRGTWPNEAFLRDGNRLFLQSDYEALEYYPNQGPDGEFVQWIDPEDLAPGVFYNPGNPEFSIATLPGQLPPQSFRVATEEWCSGTIIAIPPDFFEFVCVGSSVDTQDGSVFFAPYSPFPALSRNDFWEPTEITRAFHSEGRSDIHKLSRYLDYTTGEYPSANIWWQLNEVSAGLGRNGMLDPISVPPDPTAPAGYYDIQSVEHESLMSLPYRLVLVGELPENEPLPDAVTISFPLNWRQDIGWNHPPSYEGSLSCAFAADTPECSWAEAEIRIVSSDESATLEDDLSSPEWTDAAYDVFTRQLDLQDLNNPDFGDQQYYFGLGGSALPEFGRREKVVQKAFPEDVMELGIETDRRFITVPVVDASSVSFYMNLYTRAYATAGADSAGLLKVSNSVSLIQNASIDPEFGDLFGLLEPLSNLQAESAGESVSGPNDSAPIILGGIGDTMLSCSYTGLSSGTMQLASYYLHRPQQAPVRVNFSDGLPFLCRNDLATTQTLFKTNGAFLIYTFRPPRRADTTLAQTDQNSSVQRGSGHEWYRLDPSTGTVSLVDLGPIMRSAPVSYAGRGLFVGGPVSGGGMFDLAVWQSDGTPAGTGVFAQASYSGVEAAGYGILHVVEDQLYFNALPDFGTDAPQGTVWRSDGTINGTLSIALPGNGVVWGSAPLRSGLVVDANALTTQGSRRDVYFVSNDSATAVAVSSWLGDQAPPNGLRLLNTHPLAGLALMFDNDAGGVYVTDGTPDGTSRLFTLPHSIGNDSLNRSALHNGYIYFAINHSSGNRSTFWRTDGTAAGTVPVSTPWQGTGVSDSTFGEFRAYNGFLAYVRRQHHSALGYQSSLWLMGQEDNQFLAFRNQTATAPPLWQDGSIQGLMVSPNGKLYFTGRRDAGNLEQAAQLLGESLEPNPPPNVEVPTDWEMFYIDMNAVSVRDPNYDPLPPAGPLRPLSSSSPPQIFRSRFEAGETPR